MSDEEVPEAGRGSERRLLIRGAAAAGVSRLRAGRICRRRVRLLRQRSHCDAYGVTRCVTM
jgi:hypothetical protein